MLFALSSHTGQCHERTEDPHVAQIDPGRGRTGCLECACGQTDNFQIRRQMRVTVELGAQLERFTAGLHISRLRVQHTIAVAQTYHTGAIE